MRRLVELNEPTAELVEADDFFRLLVSRRPLVRRDDAVRGLRGLWDPATQVVYFVDEQQLARVESIADSRLIAI